MQKSRVIFYATIILFVINYEATAQWSTSGTNIYNSNTGKVGVGTANPDEKLTVKGKIHAEEVKVDLSVPGPDYVFSPEYNLMSLFQLKEFISNNKHLPEVPSAKEMEATGVNLGEMNMLLLKKIEELTLHLIALKEQNDDLIKQVELVKAKVDDK